MAYKAKVRRIREEFYGKTNMRHINLMVKKAEKSRQKAEEAKEADALLAEVKEKKK